MFNLKHRRHSAPNPLPLAPVWSAYLTLINILAAFPSQIAEPISPPLHILVILIQLIFRDCL